MSKPMCFNCNEKRTRNTEGTRLVPYNTPCGYSNGFLQYFCSKNCATQYIEEALSLDYNWDRKKNKWRHTMEMMAEAIDEV